MKKLVFIIAICAVGLTGKAQMLGLPVAEDAASKPQGLLRASGGFVIGDDINLYGGRLTYGLAPELTVFGDFGLVDPDRGDTGWGVQAGGLMPLPVADLPFDLAARGTLGYASLDQEFRVRGWDPEWPHQPRRVKVDVDILTVNVGALASKPIERITVYGYLGLSYARLDVDGHTDSETDPALGGGVLFPVNPQFSLYAELMHIDDPWFGIGARFGF